MAKAKQVPRCHNVNPATFSGDYAAACFFVSSRFASSATTLIARLPNLCGRILTDFEK
jgi:hypothetical protein